MCICGTKSRDLSTMRLRPINSILKMAIQCNKDSDCTTGQLCVNSNCATLNAENIVAKVPSWGWAIIAVGLILIILVFVRCCCWPRKKEPDSKQSRLDKADGPAPLPKNYKKPVDLLAVADANKKVENAIVIEQQKQFRMDSAAAQLRKVSNDSTIYPGSSISQSEYNTYQQNAFPAPQVYQESQAQYGFRSQMQQVYPAQSNQVYYGNNGGLNSISVGPVAQFSTADPSQRIPNNLNVNNNHPNIKNGNYEYEIHNYGYQQFQ